MHSHKGMCVAYTIDSSALAHCSCAYLVHRCSVLCRLASQLQPNPSIVSEQSRWGWGAQTYWWQLFSQEGESIIPPLILPNRSILGASTTPDRAAAPEEGTLLQCPHLAPMVGEHFSSTGAIAVLSTHHTAPAAKPWLPNGIYANMNLIDQELNSSKITLRPS